MKKQIEQVKEFHTVFGLTVNEKPCYQLSEKDIILRSRLMMEEVKEWVADAEIGNTRVARMKELADLLYVVYGTIVSEGFQDFIERAFDEVHRSNMSKLDANGKPIMRADGKILKGPNYTEADLNFLWPEIEKLDEE